MKRNLTLSKRHRRLIIQLIFHNSTVVTLLMMFWGIVGCRKKENFRFQLFNSMRNCFFIDLVKKCVIWWNSTNFMFAVLQLTGVVTWIFYQFRRSIVATSAAREIMKIALCNSKRAWIVIGHEWSLIYRCRENFINSYRARREQWRESTSGRLMRLNAISSFLLFSFPIHHRQTSTQRSSAVFNRVDELY